MIINQVPTNWNDEKSFEEVYLTYFKKLYRLCYQHIQDVEDSKEIVHDLFHSLWERRNSLVIETSLEGYLIGATKQKILKYLRDKISAQKHLAFATADYAEASHETENAFFFNVLTDQLEELTRQLPPQCGKVFVLSRTQGLSNIEIARTLAISEKAVEYHITRALTFLRKKLSE